MKDYGHMRKWAWHSCHRIAMPKRLKKVRATWAFSKYKCNHGTQERLLLAVTGIKRGFAHLWSPWFFPWFTPP